MDPNPASPLEVEPAGHALEPAVADAIVAEAGRAYFAGCRARVAPFVDANFSFAGSARLHRHAVGWDLLRAPANLALSLPQVGLKLGAAAARGLGRRQTAAVLDRQNLFMETAVARELRWRMMTDLLRQPFEDGDRVSRDDALAEAILAHPARAGTPRRRGRGRRGAFARTRRFAPASTPRSPNTPAPAPPPRRSPPG